MRSAISGLSLRERDRVCIAYEPVWAISTSGAGISATPQDAAAVHRVLRQAFQQEAKGANHARVSILYGGSVDGTNAYSFLREKEIDGALVGGASVKLQQLSDILRAASEAIEGQSVVVPQT